MAESLRESFLLALIDYAAPIAMPIAFFVFVSPFDDIESKSTTKDADKKPFEWNCPQCLDTLMETLDKMILATVQPGNDPVPCNKISIVDSQPDSSSAGNLNPMSDDSTESTSFGHSNKDTGQLLNDGSQSLPKDHGGNKVAKEIYELDWVIESQFPEDRFPSHWIRAEFSSIEPKQNLFWLDHFDDTDLVKNSVLGECNTPLHTTALEFDWKELPCLACRIRNGIDSMRETTSMKTTAITLWTAWISRLKLAMQVPVSDCRFQSNSVYTPPITSNDASTVMCF
jgi:hypothetical protein